ncbi:DUF3140 domain-containing protein [Cereibacter sphaeroides]|uniref:DUF3140 domain-containing protein n=1 Tax=Cereibacter sphaeroides TaxID=1063 RepID=UPI0002A3EBAD|nr:DUF3140 domain-containing protein [Cereibacter sphaeroides]AZB57346.1 DUF3140 domain-containing protein [Cereibacter sphaeroides]AZB61626.1 DUF3140 domain-containing protein [Cereibacter sphaeroides]EKX58719.1 putative DNA-binding protein [Rhodobacter sp. AKP1]RHZ99321.1 DUF3140 domain-containing protein [Cereibacter sphaeroides]
MTKSHDEIWDDWQSLVNMAPADLDRWLDTEESRSVGDSSDGGESTGHRSGRRIVEIRRKRKADLAEADWDHMSRVVGYIRRHLAQGGPSSDKEHSRWRYSLMNWGHDPLK